MIALLATAVAASMTFAYVQVRGAAVFGAEDRLARVTAQVAELLRSGAVSVKTSLAAQAGNTDLREFLASPAPQSRSRALAALASVRAKSAQLVDVELWDARGENKLSVGPVTTPAPSIIRHELLGLLRSDSTVVGSIHIAGGFPVFSAAAPIRENGHTIGYLVERGRLAASPKAARALGDLVGNSAGIFIGNARRDVWSDFWFAVDGPSAIPDKTDKVFQYERRGTGGGPRYAMEKSVAGTPWLILVEFSRDKVLAPVTVFLRNATFFALALLAIAAIALWLVTDRIAGAQYSLTRKLATIEGQYWVLVDGIKDYAIFMLDTDGNVVSWNKGAERIKGYRADEIIGRHFSRFYADEDITARKPWMDLEVARAEGRFEDEGWRIQKDGSRHWANVVITALRDQDGALVGFAKVTRDVTERKKALENRKAHTQALMKANVDLDRNRRALKVVNEDLEAFTYSVSHDLRAPIRQIEGFSRILEEHLGATDPEAEKYLRRIQDGSQQMGRLVDDLLNFAQLGRNAGTPRAVSLSSLVGEVIVNVRAEAMDRMIEWKINPLPVMECDAGLMKVVFTNLLSNAVKYTRPREHAVIEVGQTTKDGRIVLFVRDNGVGFDMKYADKLFGVFQRLHRAEEFEGTGVGLATVHRIIRKHNGSIWSEAAPNKGATFYFTLGVNEIEPQAAIA